MSQARIAIVTVITAGADVSGLAANETRGRPQNPRKDSNA
jgi:hypothetical protein